MLKPAYHHIGVRRPRTIELILSVTVPKVWPGAITGGVPLPATAGRGSSIGCSESATLFTDLRVDVPDRGQIGRPRAGVQLAEQRVVPLPGLQLRHAAARIVEVAEDDRVGRTGLLARGLDLAIGDAALALLRFDPRLVDPLHAVGALLHD